MAWPATDRTIRWVAGAETLVRPAKRRAIISRVTYFRLLFYSWMWLNFWFIFCAGRIFWKRLNLVHFNVVANNCNVTARNLEMTQSFNQLKSYLRMTSKGQNWQNCPIQTLQTSPQTYLFWPRVGNGDHDFLDCWFLQTLLRIRKIQVRLFVRMRSFEEAVTSWFLPCWNPLCLRFSDLF